MVTVRVRVRYDILTERFRDRVVPVFIRVTSSASVTTVCCAVTLKYLLTSVTLMDIRATTTTTRGRPISVVGGNVLDWDEYNTRRRRVLSRHYTTERCFSR